MLTRLKQLGRVLTTVPRNIDKKSLATWALAGGGIALTAALLSSRKNRLRNALVATAAGTALGGYANLVLDNIRTEAGGHWRNDPDYYNTDTLLAKAKQRYEATGSKDVVLYVDGSKDTPGGVVYSEEKGAPFIYRWGDGEQLGEAMKTLKSAGYNPRVVSHSSGGTAVFDAMDRLGKEFNPTSVDLLDPVDFNVIRQVKRLFADKSEPRAGWRHHMAGRRNVHSNPTTWSQHSDNYSNTWVRFNPFLVRSTLPGFRGITHPEHNHGFRGLGLRYEDVNSMDSMLANINNM